MRYSVMLTSITKQRDLVEVEAESWDEAFTHVMKNADTFDLSDGITVSREYEAYGIGRDREKE